VPSPRRPPQAGSTAGTLPGQDGTTAVVRSGEATDGTEAPQDPAGDDAIADDTVGDETVGGDGSTGEDGAGDIPGEDGAADDGSGDPATEAPVTAPELTEEKWAEGPADGQAFGDWVSQGARNGWVSGERVSDAAHQRNADRKAAPDAADGADVPVEQPEPVETAEPVEVAPAPAPTSTDAGGNGRGHGNGHAGGNGNGKNGK
jgi:hypothetical protein